MKKYIHSTIIFAILAIPIAILNYNLFESFADSPLIIICEWLVAAEELAEMGITVADVADDLFILLVWLNICLLALTYVYIIILDTINISLHWLIKSGIFVGLIILIDQYFLNSTLFEAMQLLSMAGVFQLTIYTTIYYLTMFLIILVVKNWLCKKHV